MHYTTKKNLVSIEFLGLFPGNNRLAGKPSRYPWHGKTGKSFPGFKIEILPD
jgi:hypothetical protein